MMLIVARRSALPRLWDGSPAGSHVAQSSPHHAEVHPRALRQLAARSPQLESTRLCEVCGGGTRHRRGRVGMSVLRHGAPSLAASLALSLAKTDLAKPPPRSPTRTNAREGTSPSTGESDAGEKRRALVLLQWRYTQKRNHELATESKSESPAFSTDMTLQGVAQSQRHDPRAGGRAGDKVRTQRGRACRRLCRERRSSPGTSARASWTAWRSTRARSGGGEGSWQR